MEVRDLDASDANVSQNSFNTLLSSFFIFFLTYWGTTMMADMTDDGQFCLRCRKTADTARQEGPENDSGLEQKWRLLYVSLDALQ